MTQLEQPLSQKKENQKLVYLKKRMNRMKKYSLIALKSSNGDGGIYKIKEYVDTWDIKLQNKPHCLNSIFWDNMSKLINDLSFDTFSTKTATIIGM